VEPRYVSQYGADSRIAAYHIQHWDGGKWVDIVSGRVPVAFQIHQFRRVTAERVRLILEGSGKVPGISDFAIYDEPVAP
jgi:hypothetical protein